MQRTILNFWLDLFMLVVFIGLIGVSSILRFVFPPGVDAAGWRLWGAGHQVWSEAQFILLAMMVLLVLLHLMLHWSWVCGVLTTRILPSRRPTPGQPREKRKMDEGVQTLYGVALLMLALHLLGGLILAALLTVESPL